MSAVVMDTAGWLVEALVASTLLMALVLVARAPVRRLFGPQLGYALWALPMLRLVLPPLPAGWREQVTMPIAYAGEAVTVLIVPVTDAVPVAAVSAAGLPWGAILATGWALGAIGFFGLHLWRHRRFCARLLGEARLLDRIGGVRVIETPAASGPLAFGIARRFVAFPRDFADRYDAGERELALAHELGHHARGDLVANWVALGVLALHWFNPIAWRAFRAFRCDQELANDARVLAGRSRVDRHAYACAILKAAHGGAVSAACHLHTIADLKGRLTMLTNTRISRVRFATGAMAVLGLVTAGLAVTASGTRAAAAVTDGLEAATGVALQAPPAVPAPPAPPAAVSDRHVRRVVIVKDGRTQVLEGAAADRYAAAAKTPVPPMPPVAGVRAVPPAPAAPSTLGVPPLPPVPPILAGAGETATVTDADGKNYRVIVTKPGDRFTMVAPPAVMSRSCRDGVDGGPRQFVLHRRDGNRMVTIMCSNRVQTAAAAGAAMAADSATIEANAIRQAREGLRNARAGIATNRDMTDAQRAQALAGITQAEAELAASDARSHRN
jgi:beta-lactamase regulating signal transducer with metallopeptidase domain